MATGQPQTIGEALFTEVARLFEQTEPVSAFVLARIKRDADKLQAASAVEASVVKSALAAYEWNYEEASRWVKNAVALRKSAVNYQNAAVTMRAINDFESAQEYSRLAVACAPSDPFVVFEAANSLVLSGRIFEAHDLIQPLRAKSEKLNDLTIELEEILDAMAHIGVPEERVIREMAVASKVATANKRRILSVDHFVAHDPDGDMSVCLPLKFMGDIEAELRLEAELSEKLSSDAQWDPQKLSVEFSYQ